MHRLNDFFAVQKIDIIRGYGSMRDGAEAVKSRNANGVKRVREGEWGIGEYGMGNTNFVLKVRHFQERIAESGMRNQ